MRHDGSTYKNTRVDLDGNVFHNCTFEHCVVVYSGGEPPQLVGCSFNATSFKFEGAAERTIGFMGALYRGGLVDFVQPALDYIQADAPPNTAPPLTH